MSDKNVRMMKVTEQTLDDVKKWVVQFNNENYYSNNGADTVVRLRSCRDNYMGGEFYLDCRHPITGDIIYAFEIYDGDWLILGKSGKFYTCPSETMDAIVDIVSICNFIK